MVDMTETATDTSEPVWNLERRDSSGMMFWCRDASKVKFRLDVDVMEYVQDPDEHTFHIIENTPDYQLINNTVMAWATCITAIAISIWWYIKYF